jgi:antitoxin component of MazEF toxin-antitoxin module
MVGYTMSSVLEVKMINEGDSVRLVVPKSYFHQLGLEKGDTLLVTVEEERAKTRKRNVKVRPRRFRHN